MGLDQFGAIVPPPVSAGQGIAAPPAQGVVAPTPLHALVAANPQADANAISRATNVHPAIVQSVINQVRATQQPVPQGSPMLAQGPSVPPPMPTNGPQLAPVSMTPPGLVSTTVGPMVRGYSSPNAPAPVAQGYASTQQANLPPPPAITIPGLTNTAIAPPKTVSPTETSTTPTESAPGATAPTSPALTAALRGGVVPNTSSQMAPAGTASVPLASTYQPDAPAPAASQEHAVPGRPGFLQQVLGGLGHIAPYLVAGAIDARNPQGAGDFLGNFQQGQRYNQEVKAQQAQQARETAQQTFNNNIEMSRAKAESDQNAFNNSEKLKEDAYRDEVLAGKTPKAAADAAEANLKTLQGQPTAQLAEQTYIAWQESHGITPTPEDLKIFRDPATGYKTYLDHNPYIVPENAHQLVQDKLATGKYDLLKGRYAELKNLDDATIQAMLAKNQFTIDQDTGQVLKNGQIVPLDQADIALKQAEAAAAPVNAAAHSTEAQSAATNAQSTRDRTYGTGGAKQIGAGSGSGTSAPVAIATPGSNEASYGNQYNKAVDTANKAQSALVKWRENNSGKDPAELVSAINAANNVLAFMHSTKKTGPQTARSTAYKANYGGSGITAPPGGAVAAPNVPPGAGPLPPSGYVAGKGANTGETIYHQPGTDNFWSPKYGHVTIKNGRVVPVQGALLIDPKKGSFTMRESIAPPTQA